MRDLTKQDFEAHWANERNPRPRLRFKIPNAPEMLVIDARPGHYYNCVWFTADGYHHELEVTQGDLNRGSLVTIGWPEPANNPPVE